MAIQAGRLLAVVLGAQALEPIPDAGTGVISMTPSALVGCGLGRQLRELTSAIPGADIAEVRLRAPLAVIEMGVLADGGRRVLLRDVDYQACR
jgi:hypothetical protein